jgi:phosphonate metabolism protein (transferase hexapeptide repeat family)
MSNDSIVTQTSQAQTAQALSEAPAIHETAKLKDSFIGVWTSIDPNTKIQESEFGDYSYTAGDAQIIYSKVGKFCSIASHVRLNPGNHPMWRVTQHHSIYRRQSYGFGPADDEEFFNWRRDHKVVVGHDVWIGHGAIVMPGLMIGTGAVIGSGAVVTKDVPPYTIAVGIPAKPIKERFPKEVAAKLLEIAWWDWSRELLEEQIDEFNDLEPFLEKYSKF